MPHLTNLRHTEANVQRQEKEVSKAVGAIEHWLPRFDVMVIGPGLGRDAWVHATVTEVRCRSYASWRCFFACYAVYGTFKDVEHHE